MSQHILVTGAAGFIASHLIQKLTSLGFSVTGIDNFDDFYSRELKRKNVELAHTSANGNFSFFEGDICDAKFLSSLKGGFDAVIHIAAKAGVRPSIEKPLDYIQVNIEGTQNILDLMQKQGCKKLVFASSSSVYGNNEKVPFQETDSVDKPISPYAFTKKANELQIHTAHHLHDIDAVCLRFFTVFGPRQRPDLAIRKFVTKILNNEPIEMYGDGSTGRDYTYVEDTVDGIIRSLNYIQSNSRVYEIINLGNSSPITLKEMIYTIYELMGKEPNIKQLPMQPGDVELTYADISKAQKLLGYQPQTSFKEGLRKFIDWMQSQQ